MDRLNTAGSSKPADTENSGSITGSINRSKEAVSSAVSQAADAAEVNLQVLQSDLKDLKETVAALVARAGNETAKSAREIAGQVGSAAAEIAERGANAASAATDQAKTFAAELENIARRNPLGAIAGAVFVGVLIGMMGRRS